MSRSPLGRAALVRLLGLPAAAALLGRCVASTALKRPGIASSPPAVPGWRPAA